MRRALLARSSRGPITGACPPLKSRISVKNLTMKSSIAKLADLPLQQPRSSILGGLR